MSDKEKIYKHLEVLIQRYPELSSNKENIEKAYVFNAMCPSNAIAGNAIWKKNVVISLLSNII